MAITLRQMKEENLNTFFNWVKEGDLALPELQRPSVWGENKIPRLLSSIYKEYPFGIFLIWTPEENQRMRIRTRPYAFDHDKHIRNQKPSRYLIDGQQRLTAFYKAFHDEGNVKEKNVKIVFNIRTEEFELWNKKYSDTGGWHELRHLLNFNDRERVKFKDKYKKDIGEKQLDGIFEKLSRLKPENIGISYFDVDKKPYSDVVEIFEVINLGLPVKRSQIVLGKISTIFPGVVEKVEAIGQRKGDTHLGGNVKIYAGYEE